MALNTDNVRAGITGGAWVGNIGTTAPVSPTAAPGVGWSELGYLNEDGITEGNEADTTEFPAWQNGTIVRRYITGSSTTFAFTCLETKYDTLKLYYPGSTIETAGGVSTITVRNPTSDPRAFLFRVIDGKLDDGVTDRVMLIAVPKGELTERGEIVYSNGDPIGYEMTITAYPDADGVIAYKLTNDPAVAEPV